MLLSVLIPTLQCRAESLARLLGHLDAQRDRCRLGDAVEILIRRDEGEEPVGRKRNRLLEQAAGDFVAFIDDDDTVSDDYLALICTALREHPEIDCVGIRGVITFRGRHPQTFIHSLRYRDYFKRGDTFYRPPYHLNPMRRSVALRYHFEEVSYGEDVEWALRICRDEALRSEHFIDAALYFYHSRRRWAYEWLLDHTETARHTLGLRFVNRLRTVRWLRSFFMGSPP